MVLGGPKRGGPLDPLGLVLGGPSRNLGVRDPEPRASESPALVVCYPFKIRSYICQSPFEVCAHFPSVSNLFSYSFHLLHVEVYDFYNLLKSVHAGQQFACGSKKDSNNLTGPIRIVLVLTSHASLKHILCLRGTHTCAHDKYVTSRDRRQHPFFNIYKRLGSSKKLQCERVLEWMIRTKLNGTAKVSKCECSIKLCLHHILDTGRIWINPLLSHPHYKWIEPNRILSRFLNPL